MVVCERLLVVEPREARRLPVAVDFLNRDEITEARSRQVSTEALGEDEVDDSGAAAGSDFSEVGVETEHELVCKSDAACDGGAAVDGWAYARRRLRDTTREITRGLVYEMAEDREAVLLEAAACAVSEIAEQAGFLRRGRLLVDIRRFRIELTGILLVCAITARGVGRVARRGTCGRIGRAAALRHDRLCQECGRNRRRLRGSLLRRHGRVRVCDERNAEKRGANDRGRQALRA